MASASYRVFKSFIKPPETPEVVLDREPSTPQSSQLSFRLSESSFHPPLPQDRPRGFPTLKSRPIDPPSDRPTPVSPQPRPEASVDDEDSLDVQSLFSEAAVAPPLPPLPQRPRLVHPQGFPLISGLKRPPLVPATVLVTPATPTTVPATCAVAATPSVPAVCEEEEGSEIFGDPSIACDYHGDALSLGDLVRAVQSGLEGTVVRLVDADAVVVIGNKFYQVNGVHIVKLKTSKKPQTPLEVRPLIANRKRDPPSESRPQNPPGLPDLEKLTPAVVEVVQRAYEPSESEPSFGPPSLTNDVSSWLGDQGFDEDQTSEYSFVIPEDFDVTGLPLPGELKKRAVAASPGRAVPSGFPVDFGKKRIRGVKVKSLEETRVQAERGVRQSVEVAIRTRETEAAKEAELPAIDEDPWLPVSRATTAADSTESVLPGEVLVPSGSPSLLDLHVFKEITLKKYEDYAFPERPKHKIFQPLGSSLLWTPVRLLAPERARKKRSVVVEAETAAAGGGLMVEKRKIAVRIILGKSKELESPVKLLASLNASLNHPNLGDYLGYDLVPLTTLENNGGVAKLFKRSLHAGGANMALCIYSGFLNGGSVVKQLNQDFTFAPQWQREWAARRHLWKVLDALVFLHKQGQTHGAVLARNVLTNKEGTDTVLGDCALAAMFRRNPDKLEHYGRERFEKGDDDLVYLPPERLATNEDSFTHDSRSEDVWQLGLMAIELLSEEPPTWGHSVDDIVGLTTEIGVADALPKMPRASMEAIAFIRACLIKDPYDRPTAETLQKHHWFREQPEWAVNM